MWLDNKKLGNSIIGVCLLLVLLILGSILGISYHALGFVVFGVPLVFMSVFFWNEVINSILNE